MLLQLFINAKEIISTDGLMQVDGRFNQRNILLSVKERNKRMVNFPHKICNGYAIYRNNDIKLGYSKIINF